MKLEEIVKGTVIVGIDAGGPVTIVSIDAAGDAAITVFFRRQDGSLGERMLFRADEPGLQRATTGRPWSFGASGEDFRLAVEAYRIRLAHLFDPMMAVHTSDVEPLPHQISAVYETMLEKRPLRFVLADDPGAGKTIMAGLLVRELVMRADAQRILIVAPGSLCGQWQDELLEKFGLKFEIFSREKQEGAASGNYFAEEDRLIARLDQLSRSDELLAKLETTHWDLIIVDEAHKLSANYFGGKVNKTRRYVLGEKLGALCRHFLLMTATPHNGKEEDFQLFLGLLDGDRFYGKFREGAHKIDVSDLMRRMVKEDLLRFDGTRLFPERRAYTANYELSDREAALYERVTTYVREEMNRADKLDDQKQRGTVGFALTQLQRRLASSPEAIFQSLRRRRKRLETRLDEERILARGQSVAETVVTYQAKVIELPDTLEDIDEDLSAEDREIVADEVTDRASAARTIEELEAEIFALRSLEEEAAGVVQGGSDRKWEQLSQILHDRPEMRSADGSRRKLIIFTEYRDTLAYLQRRIGDFLGLPGAVVTIHGSVNRDERRKVQEAFRQDKDVLVLIATDAAGEGVNLQNANLMVNYDLPWNPNRIEQRFGRIHRIGQREICHLWNLVAAGTREGDVFRKLFDKIEIEKLALGGRVFDVLGEAFDNRSLKDLLIEAIRYGDAPEVKARLFEVIDNSLDTDKLKQIFTRNALIENHLSLESLYALKDEMDKAEARRLQPYFIRAFFLEAFARLGGDLRARETGRFEVPHVPAPIRERDRIIADTRTPVLRSYHRICFEKSDVRIDGKPQADLIHPGHPLMAAVLDLTTERNRGLMRQGALLLDPQDPGQQPRLLLLVDHQIREGSGQAQRVISRRLQFVSLRADGAQQFAGWAPHLDLQPLPSELHAKAEPLLAQAWLDSQLEQRAIAFASQQLVPEHFQEVRERRLRQIDKVHAAVRDRLIKEINHLQHRAEQLRLDVQAGRQPRIQPENLQRRAEELVARLQQREAELTDQRQIESATPMVVGAALVIPNGLARQWRGEPGLFSQDAAARIRVEAIAMQAVMEAEAALGYVPRDVSADKCGWDITSQPPMVDGRLPDARLIEVKGRARGADTITLTKNECFVAFNQSDKYWLAVVLVGEDDSVDGPYYIRQPVTQAPDWAEVSKDLDIRWLIDAALGDSK